MIGAASLLDRAKLTATIDVEGGRSRYSSGESVIFGYIAHVPLELTGRINNRSVQFVQAIYIPTGVYDDDKVVKFDSIVGGSIPRMRPYAST